MSAISRLGTRLRHLLELLDGDLDATYADLCPGYRSRFTPVVRALLEQEATTIGAIARAAGVSHSAASQTIAQMRLRGLVQSVPGEDRREAVVTASPELLAMMPRLNRIWAATALASASLDEDAGVPLERILETTIEALKREPFAQRIERELKEVEPC